MKRRLIKIFFAVDMLYEALICQNLGSISSVPR